MSRYKRGIHSQDVGASESFDERQYPGSRKRSRRAHRTQEMSAIFNDINAVNHLFLPRRLPRKLEEQPWDFSTVLQCFLAENLKLSNGQPVNVLPPEIVGMIETWISWPVLKEADDLLEMWSSMCGSTPTVPVHVHEQNAILTFTADRNDVIVRCFQVQPQMKEVAEAKHAVAMTHLITAVRVRRELIFCRPIAWQIVGLQNTLFMDALPSVGQGKGVRETREPPSCCYVSEWLMSCLGSLGSVEAQSLAVCKKYRDSVQFSRSHSQSDKPWRRSANWMGFKAVLHTLLVDTMGDRAGVLVYKVGMLRFLLSFCPPFTQHRDICHQMLAKVARRAHKLEQLYNIYSMSHSSSPKICAAVRLVLADCLSTVKSASFQLDKSWKKAVQLADTDRLAICDIEVDDSRSATATTLRLQFSSHWFSKLMKGETQAKSLARTENMQGLKVKMSQFPRSLNELSSIFVCSETNKLLCVLNFEQTVLKEWIYYDEPRLTCSKLRQTLCEYSQLFSSMHEGNESICDPVSYSRYLLVSFVIMMQCDKRARALYPVLLDHPSSIITDVLACILATDVVMLQAVRSVKNYFCNRNSRGQGRDSPLEAKVSDASLSVSVVQSDETFKRHLEDLRRKEEIEIASHEKAFARSQQEVQHLSCLCQLLSCTCDGVSRMSKCQKCRLAHQIRDTSTCRYERLLPRSQAEQCAVVFEVHTPEEIRAWRDGLVYFHAQVLQSFQTMTNRQTIHGWWVPKIKGTKKAARGLVCTLVSTICSSSLNHHGRSFSVQGSGPPDVVVECGMDCYLGLKDPSLIGLRALDNRVMPRVGTASVAKERCAFKVSQRMVSLQPWLIGYEHQQSEVIARQSDRPDELSNREFVAFGSLRAGQHLQWFNMLRYLQQKLLPLHLPEVLLLIAQTTWQAGTERKSDENTCSCARCPDLLGIAHWPCSNVDLMAELAKELLSILEVNHKNWQNKWTLCGVVIVANRMLELTSAICQPDRSVSASLKVILLHCRRVCVDWLRSLQDVLQKSNSAADSAKLRSDIVSVSLFGCLTFCHSFGLSNTSMNADGQALWQWLTFISVVHKHESLIKAQPAYFQPTLLTMTRQIALSRLQELSQALRQNIDIEESGLFQFLQPILGEGRPTPGRIHDASCLWLELEWERPSKKIQIKM